MREKGTIEKIICPEEGKFHVHSSPVGTMWVSTLVKVYEHYREKEPESKEEKLKIQGKVEVLKDLLDFSPDAEEKEV